MSTVLDIGELEDMASELLSLLPDGLERDVYFDMSKLAEECGEVAACLNKSAKTDKDLGDELADVIVVCFIIAHKKGVDLNDAIIRKHSQRIEKVLKRFHNGQHPSRCSVGVEI